MRPPSVGQPFGSCTPAGEAIAAAEMSDIVGPFEGHRRARGYRSTALQADQDFIQRLARQAPGVRIAVPGVSFLVHAAMAPSSARRVSSR